MLNTGPYQHGTGFIARNGASSLQLFDANIPISVTPTVTGPGLPNVYASEFGCVVMSSFESMSPTLAQEHWGLHAGEAGGLCEDNLGWLFSGGADNETERRR